MSFVTATAAGALAWMGGMLVLGLGGRPVLILLAIGAALVTQRRWLGVLPLLDRSQLLNHVDRCNALAATAPPGERPPPHPLTSLATRMRGQADGATGLR